VAKLALAISLIQCTKCDRSERDDTADLARSKKKPALNHCCNAVGITLGISKSAIGDAMSPETFHE
jgi:hypothetical protein